MIHLIDKIQITDKNNLLLIAPLSDIEVSDIDKKKKADIDNLKPIEAGRNDWLNQKNWNILQGEYNLSEEEITFLRGKFFRKQKISDKSDFISKMSIANKSAETIKNDTLSLIADNQKFFREYNPNTQCTTTSEWLIKLLGLTRTPQLPSNNPYANALNNFTANWEKENYLHGMDEAGLGHVLISCLDKLKKKVKSSKEINQVGKLIMENGKEELSKLCETAKDLTSDKLEEIIMKPDKFKEDWFLLAHYDYLENYLNNEYLQRKLLETFAPKPVKNPKTGSFGYAVRSGTYWTSQEIIQKDKQHQFLIQRLLDDGEYKFVLYESGRQHDESNNEHKSLIDYLGIKPDEHHPGHKCREDKCEFYRSRLIIKRDGSPFNEYGRGQLLTESEMKSCIKSWVHKHWDMTLWNWTKDLVFGKRSMMYLAKDLMAKDLMNIEHHKVLTIVRFLRPCLQSKEGKSEISSFYKPKYAGIEASVPKLVTGMEERISSFCVVCKGHYFEGSPIFTTIHSCKFCKNSFHITCLDPLSFNEVCTGKKCLLCNNNNHFLGGGYFLEGGMDNFIFRADCPS